MKIGYGDKMATDVSVTTSTWGTENLKKATGEIYDKTAQNQIADNTGYNYHYPKELVSYYSSPNTETGVDSNGTITSNKGYSISGLYLAKCRLYHIATGADLTSGTVTFFIDGTQLYIHTAAAIWSGTTVEFEGTVQFASDGWRGASYTSAVTSGGGGNGTVSSNYAQVFLRGI